jgi:phosphorylase/glycogen(starch) synthase
MLKADNYSTAAELAQWKENIRSAWDEMEIVSVRVPDASSEPLKLGKLFKAEIEINSHGIPAGDLGVELLFGKPVHGLVERPLFIEPLNVVNESEQTVTFACSFKVEHTGRLDFAFRIYPKNNLLPHRQDFPMVKWV